MTPTRQQRLGVSISLGALAWALPSAAALTVLVPAKIAEVAPADKVQLLAAVTVVGSLAALVAAISFGALSDATRSRFGSRAPWMIAGGVLAAGALVLLSMAHDLPSILLWWAVFQIAMNALISPLKAVLADRVPAERLGRVSSLYGAATLAGFAIGAVAGAQFITQPDTGLKILAVVIAVLPIAAVLIAPDESNVGFPRAQHPVARALTPPRRAPDFYWALGGRFGVMLGTSMITTFQLYILTDYAHLETEAAGRTISLAAVFNLAASLLGSLVSGALSDRFQRRRTPVVFAAAIIATAMVFPLLVPEGWAMLVFAALAGLGLGVYYAVDVALMTEVLPDGASRSRDLGILNISNTGGQTLAPGVSALVVGALGFAPVFLLAMAVTIIAGLSTFKIKTVK